MMKQYLALFICLCLATDTIGQTTVTWCTVETNEQAKCEGMKEALVTKNILSNLACVQGIDHTDCVKKIHNGEADLITLDGGDIYTAGIEYGVQAVSAEEYIDGKGYYAVAVAKKSDTSVTINSLRGKTSCHTGVKKTAGWNVPVGFLLREGLMDVVDCNSDIKSAGMFFTQSCAPGALLSKYNKNGDNPTSLCDSCNGTGEAKCDRSSSEPYYNYDGAFRCMAEGAGDVAFVKHLTVPAYTDGKSDKAWAKYLQSNNYVLLCPDGTRKAVAEFATCNLAWVPSHAVITSASATVAEINTFRKLLLDAQLHFTADDSGVFAMFDSGFYQGTDLMFKDSTVSLQDTATTDYEGYLGEAYLNTIRGLSACPEGTARICVISDGESKKCEAMKAAFTAEGFKPDISCQRAEDHDGCMKRIRDNQADLITLGGADIVKAGNTYRMQPVAGENYDIGDETASYWAVVVAKKGTNFGFDELKGKKSCHTGIMRTSGWIVPVGTLIDQEQISVDENCDVAGAVGGYFSSSCVPGAKNEIYDEAGTNPDNLCDLCIGEGEDKCSGSSSREPYSGYTGAFRCLAEGAGEVAFVKHVTVGDNTDENNLDPWARNLKKADFELLCPDGSRKSIDDWSLCNLARVPSHAVMTSEGKSTAEKEVYWNLLNNGQRAFANDSGSVFRMFDSAQYSGLDFIFKDSTVSLIDVDDKNTYKKWVGDEYLKSYEAVTCMSVIGAASEVVANVVVIIVSLMVAMFNVIF